MVAVGSADAYSLNGKTWPSGTVTFQLNLGPSAPLSDGSPSWDAAVLPVFDMWNQRMGRLSLAGVMNSSAPVASNDKVNSVSFSNSVFGQAFGSGTLAVTYYMMQGSNLIEADVLFNRAQTFDSYRGPLRFPAGGGQAVGDIRRVFLHELGHGLGLNHSGGDNVMSPMISDREVLSNDDVAGIQAMYGAGAPPPPPPPPPAALSHLANISTRMKVGVDENVLIAGFIVKGSEPKRMILRATGPSIAHAIAGALGDTTLELYDGTGSQVAENNNWQESAQASEIAETGVAPNHPLEAAIVANLAPGNYTAIVRGHNRTQGIAVVEGYELDATSTRLVNLSTRGRIGVGDEVLIGGLIVQGANGKNVIVRTVGPSLASVIAGTLSNPSLEMYDGSGNQIATNDDWNDSPQRAEIIASTVPPSHPLESAIVTTLAPGSYTAIVRGVNGGTGVGLVEVFDLEP